ncbi:MAG: hypothetical protein PVH61_43225 [Candidatus Aminicenantes bacterium]|jgi:hypothetical protein
MSQKNQLNLVSLYQRQEQEEMSESEMKVVVAGVNCPCVFIELYYELSGAEEPSESCNCGSMWVIFGLAWG